MGQQHQHGGGGVKVKFIETQFVSSDAASFKAVVQLLTGKSAPSPSPPATRPNRPIARVAATEAAAPYPASHHFAAPVKQESGGGGGAGFPAATLEDLHELCDFGDLLYTTGVGARRVDGAAGYGGFPY